MDKLIIRKMASSEHIGHQVAGTQAGASKKVAAAKQIVFHYVAGSCIFERRTIPLTPNIECEIGRAIEGVCEPCKTNAIFDCRVLSRNHAAVWCDRDEKYWIQDRKSSNGTFVNGIKLGELAAELHCGDIIQLGSNVLTTAEKSFFKCVVVRVGLPQRAPVACPEHLPVIFNKTQMQIFLNSLEMELKNIEKEIFQCPLKNEILALIDEQLACHQSAKEILKTANAERCAALQQLNKIELSLTASTNECENLRKQIATLQSRHKIVKERLRLQVMVYQECCVEKAKQHFRFEQESKQRIEKLNQQLEECEKDYEHLCGTIAAIMKDSAKENDHRQSVIRSRSEQKAVEHSQPAAAEAASLSKDKPKIDDLKNVEVAKPQVWRSKSDIFKIIEQKQHADRQQAPKNHLNRQQQAAVQKTTSLLKMAVELFNEIYEEIFTNHIKTTAACGHEKRADGFKSEAIEMEAKRVVRFIIKKIVTLPKHAQLKALDAELEQQSNSVAAAPAPPLRQCDGNLAEETVGQSESKAAPAHEIVGDKTAKENCDVTLNLTPAAAEVASEELSTEQLEKEQLKLDRKIIIVQENFRSLTVMPYITILVTIAYILIAYLFMKYL